MIKIETITIEDREFIKTYSDLYKIRKEGTDEIYDEAYDLAECPQSYVETDIPVEKEESYEN